MAMAPDRPTMSRPAAALGLGLLAALGFASQARSQHTPDPYNYVGEYNRGYEPYMFAVAPNDQSSVPNQAVLSGQSGVRQANQYQSSVEELDGVDISDGLSSPDPFASGRGGPSGAGVPYYRANRRYDRTYNRTYRPNQSADQGYYEDLESRHGKYIQNQQEGHNKYLQYLRESDPTRRAQLYRDYIKLNARGTNDLGTARGSTTPPDRSRSALDAPDDPSEATDPRLRAPTPGRSGRAGPSLYEPLESDRARGPAAPSLPRSLAPGLSSPSGTARSPSDILRRSERLDRNSRVTVPRSPMGSGRSAPEGATAPAPR